MIIVETLLNSAVFDICCSETVIVVVFVLYMRNWHIGNGIIFHYYICCSTKQSYVRQLQLTATDYSRNNSQLSATNHTTICGLLYKPATALQYSQFNSGQPYSR